MDMLSDEFWDKDEYEYFSKLSDIDKIEYAISLFQLDEVDMINEIITKERMEEFEDEMKVSIEDDFISIESNDIKMIDDFMSKFMMDGHLIKTLISTKNKRSYTVMDKLPPISPN